jgi:hypothetical protein
MGKELTREELFELVWSEPMLALSKKFEISDVGLRKICKRHDIPLPKLGHWQRVRAGRNIQRPTLPKSDNEEKITLVEMDRPTGKKVYPWTQRQIEIESDPNLNLVVPERLRNSDAIIVAARKALSNSENNSYKFSGMRDSGWGALDIVVQPKLMRRALAFMNTLIKLLKARGHEIEVQHDATYAIIKEYRAKIQLKERSRIVTEQNGNWPTRRFLPTGILAFKADAWGHLEWVDGSRKLEEQLSNIVARLEIQVEELHEIWRQNRIREEEERERIRLIEEAQKRKEDELAEFKSLLSQADRWKKVQVLREYLSNAKLRAVAENRLSDKFNAWLEWATKKTDWYDPYVEASDELLIDVDREDLTFRKPADIEELDDWQA